MVSAVKRPLLPPGERSGLREDLVSIEGDDGQGALEQHATPDDEYGHGLGVVVLPRKGRVRWGPLLKPVLDTVCEWKRNFRARLARRDNAAPLGAPPELAAIWDCPLAPIVDESLVPHVEGFPTSSDERPLAAESALALAPGVPSVGSNIHLSVHLALALEQCAHIVSAVPAAAWSGNLAKMEAEDTHINEHFLRTKAGFASATSEASRLGVSTWKLGKWRRLCATAVVVAQPRGAVRMLRRVVADLRAHGCMGRCVGGEVQRGRGAVQVRCPRPRACQDRQVGFGALRSWPGALGGNRQASGAHQIVAIPQVGACSPATR